MYRAMPVAVPVSASRPVGYYGLTHHTSHSQGIRPTTPGPKSGFPVTPKSARAIVRSSGLLVSQGEHSQDLLPVQGGKFETGIQLQGPVGVGESIVKAIKVDVHDSSVEIHIREVRQLRPRCGGRYQSLVEQPRRFVEQPECFVVVLQSSRQQPQEVHGADVFVVDFGLFGY